MQELIAFVELAIGDWRFGPSKISIVSKKDASVYFTFVMGKHWTGSPNKSIDQIGKNCPKNV